MKPLPKADLSYRPLHNMAMGPLKAALMNCALDLKLFDRLCEPGTYKEVAAALGIHQENTRRLLDSLAILGLLDKKGDTYWNLPLAQSFLASQSPTWIGPLLKQTQNKGLNPLEALDGLVKDGPDLTMDPSDLADEAVWEEEVRASAGWAFGGVGQMVAEKLAGLPGFSSLEKMLDIGCGHGVFSLYILAASENLSAVLMDRAGVLRAARPLVEAYGAGDRVSYLAKDYIKDEIGRGYDMIFASSTLNFAKGCLGPLVSKIHDALNPGGYFVSFQDGYSDATKPDTLLGAVIPSMMMGMDYGFEQGEIARTAIECNFQSVRSFTLSTPIGEMDMDIARKSQGGES